MTGLAVLGHPPAPGRHVGSKPAAVRAAAGSRVAAYRDAQVPHSCSVDTAHAVTAQPSEHATAATDVQALPPWPQLSAAVGTHHSSRQGTNGSHAAVDTHQPSTHLLLQHQQQRKRQQLQQQHASLLTLTQQQHSALQHSSQQQHGHVDAQPAAAAVPKGYAAPPGGLWLQQHRAAAAQWRLLSGPDHDETSGIILACSSAEQLLSVAQNLLLSPASKWHYARLAAMAAVLTTQTPQQQPAAAGQQQQQQQQQRRRLQQHAAGEAADPAAAAATHVTTDHNVHLGSAVDATSRLWPSNGASAGPLWPSQQQQQVEHHALAFQQQPEQQQQQQQQRHVEVHIQLVCSVLDALLCPCVNSDQPALQLLHGAPLAEALHAVQLLLQHTDSMAQQQQLLPQQGLQQRQQQLQRHLAVLLDSTLLSAVHGACSVQQLQSIVTLSAQHVGPSHTKAAFVQLARLARQTPSDTSSNSDSSSSNLVAGVLQQLLELLSVQLPQLQPHQCAAVLWSLGQMQAWLSGTGPADDGGSPSSGSSPSSSSNGSSAMSTVRSMQQQLLQGGFSGLERLNARTCAQLLHGAAQLRLSVSPDALAALQQHTQAVPCGPGTLSCLLTSFAALHGPTLPGPSEEWLQFFYSSCQQWLRPSSLSLSNAQPGGSLSSSSSTSSGSQAAGALHHALQQHKQPLQQQQQQQGEEAWQKDAFRCFNPEELSSLLAAACRLQLQPPTDWLAAVADCSGRQINSFTQQELGLLLWGFARLQYVPPHSLLQAAAARAMEFRPAALPSQSLLLLLYGASKLHRLELCSQQQQVQEQVQEQQQEHEQQRGREQQQQHWLAGFKGCLPTPTAAGVAAAALPAWHAIDLAQLAWVMGVQAQLQQREQRVKACPQHAGVTPHQLQQQLQQGCQLAQVLQASTSKLLQQLQAPQQQQQLKQHFTPQGLSMLLWGMGSALHPMADSLKQQQVLGTSSSGDAQQQQEQQQPMLEQALPGHAVLVAFLEAASAAVSQNVHLFSSHELSSVAWGLGAVVKCAQATASNTGTASTTDRNSQPTSSSSSSGGSSSSSRSRSKDGSKWQTLAAAQALHKVSCELLGAVDGVSNYQLTAAVQGLVWAKHPRGLDLLHIALQPGSADSGSSSSVGSSSSRSQQAQPQELLVLLRACLAYRHVPEGAAWAGVLAAVCRLRQQLAPVELQQLLYLLGKLQMLHNQRQKQRAAQAAAAAAAREAAAGACKTQQEQGRLSRRLRAQQALHVDLQPLLPASLLSLLVVQAANCLECGSAQQVSLMLFGLSHLQSVQQQHQRRQKRRGPPQQQQQQQQQQEEPRKQRQLQGAVVAKGDAPGIAADSCVTQLLASVYPYTLQQLHVLSPGNLATLLYALHRLGARPEECWLQAVVQRLGQQQLRSLDGQSLAVLALALAGFNWMPPQAWLESYVAAAAAADRRGLLVTAWQRHCIRNSLAALNPHAARAWVA